MWVSHGGLALSTLLERAAKWHEIQEHFTPDGYPDVVEWAEDKVVLPAKEAGGRAGPWRSRLTPAFREPLNAYANPVVVAITIMASNQVSKSLTEMLCALYSLDQDPGRTMWVGATEDMVDGIVDDRLKSIIRASPKLKHHYTNAKWTKKRIDFGPMEIRKAWAGSPSSIQGHPCQKVIADELSSWMVNPDKYNPIESAKNRMLAQVDKTIVCVSTPDVESDLICQEFQSSDRRKYHVPCVHCGEFQVLEFTEKTVRWPKGMSYQRIGSESRANYHCTSCEKIWTDRERVRSLNAGIWVPREMELRDGRVVGDHYVSNHWGYHLNALNSTWVTPSQMASKFLELKIRNDLKTFYNFWLGLPWKDMDRSPEASLVARCAGDHEEDELPEGTEYLTAGIDVQKVELYFAIRAWGYNGKSWLIKSGAMTSWRDLENLLRAPFRTKSGREVRLYRSALIDWQGGRTDEVADFCRRNPEIIRPCRGKGRIENQAFKVVRPTRSGANTKIALSGIPELIEVNTDYFKTRLMRLIAEEGRNEWFVHKDVPEMYANQVTSEQKVYKRTLRGATQVVWEPKAGQPHNHLLDCEVYAMAAAESMGLPIKLAGAPPPAEQPDFDGDEFPSDGDVEGEWDVDISDW
ncbi:MAG: terminase gpA endonuclease subunit [Planctomycetota bacterium]